MSPSKDKAKDAKTEESVPTFVLDGDKFDYQPAGLSGIFRYATTLDLFMIALGSIGAIVCGLAQPGLMVVFGEMMDALNSSDDLVSKVETVALTFVVLGCISATGSFISTYCFMTASGRQTKEWRAAFLEAILRQDVGWFDVSNPSELTSRIADATQRVESGMGLKLAELIQFCAQLISGFVIGFVFEPYFSMVLMVTTPVLGVCGWFLQKVNTEGGTKTEAAYSKAGGVATEVLGEVRTVFAHNAQPKELARYVSHLDEAKVAGIKQGWLQGLGIGAFFGSFNIYNAVGVIYGVHVLSTQLDDGDCLASTNCSPSAGNVFTVLLCVQMAGMALGQIGPAAMGFAQARRAIGAMLKVIDRVPVIDAYSEAGLKPKSVTGHIDVQGVDFSYPARPDIQVCKKYTLRIDAGSTVALVGASGAGKSTLVNLVERFYDPQGGCIKLDGVDLRELNVKWLRSHIGYVGQEPRLFSGTIAENIGYGVNDRQVSQAEIEEAARKANAHDFISEFPLGYQTPVGAGGQAMSGGQKQRVAIARALIKQPKVLILDEATSALDNQSEKVVQQALDALMADKSSAMTTIVIAHRLSTIRTADKIAVVHDGSIVEEGPHSELLKIPGGHYQALHEKAGGAAQETKQGLSQNRIGSSTALFMAAGEEATETDAAHVEAVDDKTKKSNEKKEHQAAMKKMTSRLWELQRDSKGLFAIGAVGALLSGMCYPLIGGLWSIMIETLYIDDADRMRERSYWCAGIFVFAGFMQAFSGWIQFGGFVSAGENLVRKLRALAFEGLLKQDIAWFDEDAHNSGALCATLAKEAALIQDVTGGALSRHVSNVFCLGVGISAAFYFSWILALVSFSTVPFMVIASVIQLMIMQGTGGNATDVSKAGQVISEAVVGIRTVSTLALEQRLVQLYKEGLADNQARDFKATVVSALARGYSEFAMMAIDGLLFYVGGLLVDADKLSFRDMLMVIMILLMSSFGLGQSMGTMGDQTKTEAALKAIFEMIDRKPEIDSSSDHGVKITSPAGEIEFHDVHFRYPSRPQVPVCRGYNFVVKPSTTVALVGASGSGKSTAVQLMERFYDPKQGKITLDGVPLKELSVRWLRENIGLVRQEPVLFAGTVKQNILYGAPNATSEDVQWAAAMAHAHDFIVQLPEGYDTQVGDRGNRLSGGQKQRVAIARALVNRPKILLLDEATSALDSESEKIVQAAIDKLIGSHNMTTIVIAHRLSTIRNANMICVIDKGQIVEQGSHSELMDIPNGVYVNLVKTNSEA